MIKINLASSGSLSASSMGSSSSGLSADYSSPDFVRKEGLKRLVLLLVGPLALYIYENQNIPTKALELSRKQAVLAELQTYNARQEASVVEIKKFKEDEALIEARIAALEKISNDRKREIRIMELLQNTIPEKSWLTNVQISPTKLTVEGIGLSDFEVSSFLESLSKSLLLLDVNLINSSEINQDGVLLKKFEISCLLERS